MGSESIQTMNVSGVSVTEATISSLMSSTTYSIEMAALNNVGVGEYTAPVIVETRHSKLLGHNIQ